MASNAAETLAVDCGSAGATAWRALVAAACAGGAGFGFGVGAGWGAAEATAWRALMAATCAGVACFGLVGASPQKPRALMISAGVCGFGSAFSAAAAAACLDFAGWTICASAAASWQVEPGCGFEGGNGTGSGR